MYGSENGLLDLEGWKKFRRLANRQKKLIRMANQAKLYAFRNRIVFKYGVQVPRNHTQALEIDALNGNSFWQDAERTELNQIDEYETFSDLGPKGRAIIPEGYKKICVHLVYDVKQDLRRKA